MKKEYVNPIVEIIYFNEEEVITASVVVGGGFQPGEEKVDGPSLFE